MRPFSFVAKCQSKNIREQYDAGVRLFDLRVRFDKNGEPILAHGLMEYCSDNLLNDIRFLNSQKDAVVRVILETSCPNNKQEAWFSNFCYNMQENYLAITFIGGNRKFDWKSIYKFGTYEPVVVGEFSSVPTDKWYGKVNDLWPWLWAKRHNEKVLDEYITFKGYLMMDFV